MAAILKMAAILNFFNWPHILSFLTGEKLSLVKISCLLPKWHNSPKYMHQTAALIKRWVNIRLCGQGAKMFVYLILVLLIPYFLRVGDILRYISSDSYRFDV